MRNLILTLLLYIASSYAQPWDPTVLWDRSGAGEESWYGVKIVPLGDQNDDNFADFAVWALGSGEPGQINEEKIEFFYGGNPVSQNPYRTIIINPDTADNIVHIVNAGDVNNDGYQDWLIWMHYWEDPDSEAVQLYWGGPEANLDPVITLYIPIGEGKIYPLGDFNGDGFDDFYRYFFPPLDYCEIYYGGNPPDLILDVIIHSPEGMRYQALPDAFGDINGDGYSDFMSSTPPPERMTYIFFGGEQPDTVPVVTWTDFYHDADIIVNDLNNDDAQDIAFSRSGGLCDIHFGQDSPSIIPNYTLTFQLNCIARWIFSLGDINDDGYNDMAVIDDGCNNLWGTFALYLGHPWLNPDPAIAIQGRTGVLGLIGIRTAAGLGDVNGDGIDDFAIGASNTNFDGRRGRVVIISGDPDLEVGVDDQRPEVPDELTVSIYPNPFNATTIFYVELPEYVSDVQFTVFNLLGQTVSEEVIHTAGRTVRHFYSSESLTSGLYLLKVSAGMYQNIQKLVVLK